MFWKRRDISSHRINRVECREQARQHFCRLMMMAFPDGSGGVDRSEASRFLGVSTRSISNWIHGSTLPTIEQRHAIEAIIGPYWAGEVFTKDRSSEEIYREVTQNR